MSLDFKTPNNEKTYYDLFEDYGLIEASFAQQYGIRLRQEDNMSWNEFCTLLAGLNYKTPLGAIVSIRAETDPEIIKGFTKEQRKIRHDWITKEAGKISMDKYNETMDMFKNAFSSYKK